MSDRLPAGWLAICIEEIISEVNPGFPSGRHNQEGLGTPHLRPMNINARGEIDLTVLKYVEEDEHDKLAKGDVLFNNTNSPALLGKTAFIDRDSNWAYSNHMTRLRFFESTVNGKWVAFALHKLFVEGFYQQHCRNHVNQASIGKTFLLKEVRIPLPPLPEQQRIVAKIEELFTKLDAGVENLKKTKVLLKRYRQAVLKAAVEGRLTEAWREKHKNELEPASVLLERILKERREKWTGRGKYREPGKPDIAKLPQLPSEWAWTMLDRIAEIKGGITKDQNRRYSAPARLIPYLRVANVQRGYLDLTEVKEIMATEDEIQELALKLGDILFNEGGDRDKLGRGWVWNNEIPECIHQNHVFRARLFDMAFNPKFISWYANTFGQQFFFDEGKHTTNLASISMTKLKGLPIPLPPLAEQQKIVEEVERRLSVVDELVKTIEENLRRAERLRQSILKKAFSGKLVPQDPSDEPASVLLERIKAEKGKMKPAQKTRRRSTPKVKGEQMRLV